MMTRQCAVLLSLAMSIQVVTAQDNRIRIADNWQGSQESTSLNPRWYPEGYLEKLSATPDNYKAQAPAEELSTPQDSPQPISTSAEPLVHGDGACCLHEDHFEDVERLMLKAQNGDLSLNFLSKKHQCPAEEILLPHFCCDSPKAHEAAVAKEQNLVCTVDAWCKFLAKYVSMLGIPAPAEDWAVCSVNTQLVNMWESQNSPAYRAELDKLEGLVHTPRIAYRGQSPGRQYHRQDSPVIV